MILSRADLLDGILNRCDDDEAVGEEAVEIAIDATVTMVVEWLAYEGHSVASMDLKELIDGTF